MKYILNGLTVVILLAATVCGDETAPWQATIRPGRAAAVFDAAEDPHFSVVIGNRAGRSQAVTLRFEVRDYDDRLMHAGEAAATVPRGETRAVDLRLGEAAKLPHGEHLAAKVIVAADGQPQAEFRKGFGFLPKRTAIGPAERSRFGLLAEGDWPLLEQLGVRYVRPNWNWAERPMDWASRYGIAFCPLVNEANAFVRGEISEQEYSEFVRQSVRRYKQYVRYWQLGNEFDVFHREGPKSFVEAQRIGYAAAKAEDPGCLVIGGSITELQVRRQAWKEALELGLARHCDIYDFHFYADLNTTQGLLDTIHRTCRELHAEKPIWVTETTQVGMFDPDDRNQADYVFKRYAHLLANDVAVVFWHVLRWPYPFSADKVQATAMIDYDGFARPSLFAFASLARELDGARFVRRWDLGKDAYAIEFSRGARSVLVLWTETGEKGVRVRHAPGDISTIYPSGKRVAKPSPDGAIAIRLRKSPVICDLPGPIGLVTADLAIVQVAVHVEYP